MYFLAYQKEMFFAKKKKFAFHIIIVIQLDQVGLNVVKSDNINGSIELIQSKTNFAPINFGNCLDMSSWDLSPLAVLTGLE